MAELKGHLQFMAMELVAAHLLVTRGTFVAQGSLLVEVPPGLHCDPTRKAPGRDQRGGVLLVRQASGLEALAK